MGGRHALRIHDRSERGAIPKQEPRVVRDDDGEVVIAAIGTYGDTIHSLVERRNYRGLFLPGFREVKPRFQPPGVGLKYVDHCVGNVELGQMNRWVQYYGDVMGFRNLITVDDQDISTEYSSLMSKVMANGNDRIKFPINEPASGKKKSQIEEYLDFYRGPGAQRTSRSRRMTSSRPWARCAIAASSFSRRRHRITRNCRLASARSMSRSTRSRS